MQQTPHWVICPTIYFPLPFPYQNIRYAQVSTAFHLGIYFREHNAFFCSKLSHLGWCGHVTNSDLWDTRGGVLGASEKGFIVSKRETQEEKVLSCLGHCSIWIWCLKCCSHFVIMRGAIPWGWQNKQMVSLRSVLTNWGCPAPRTLVI